MAFSNALFLYVFLVTFVTCSPTPPTPPPLHNSSAVAAHNATLLPHGGRLSYFAHVQAAKIIPGVSRCSRLPSNQPFHKPSMTCSGSDKVFCEKTCGCTNGYTIWCGRFTSNELESFYVSTRKTAKVMGDFANQAKATCRQSCVCDPDTSARNEDKRKDRLKRWRKGPRKGLASGNDEATPHYHSSASSLELSSASRSQTLEPRTEAGQSIPDLLPPSPYLLWGHRSRKSIQCEGINRVYCQKRCHCTLDGAVNCDTAFTITPNTSEKQVEESKTSDSVGNRVVYISDMCRPFCLCEDVASPLLEPVKNSKERGREEREREKEARTDDLRRRSDIETVNPLVRWSSPPIPMVNDRSNFPVPFLPRSSLRTRNDDKWHNSTEMLLPVPTWLPAPKFIKPKLPKELICGGKDKPFCKDRCGCNPDGTLLCNKKFEAALKSLVGVAARDQALGSVMNKMANVLAKCGVICHCGNGFSDMGVGPVGISVGDTTGVEVGGVGVGATFRTKVVGREGMRHGKAITRRDEHNVSSLLAARGPSSSVPLSLHIRGGVGTSTELPSLGFPVFSPSSGSLTGLVCTGLSMDRGFCDRRCRCTPSRTMVCDTLTQFQITTWTTPKISRAEAEAMARGWVEGYTQLCTPKCSCNGKKRKAKDMKSSDQTPNRRSPRLSPQNSSTPAGSSLQPRSDAFSAMKVPGLLNSQPLNRTSEFRGPLRCAGQDPRVPDTQFCGSRCQCTAAGTVDCERGSQAKVVELVKKKWSQERVEMMTRKVNAAITEECRTICNCGHIVESPRLEDKDIKRTPQKSSNSSPSDSGSQDVSPIPLPLLHPRSGTLSSAAGTLSSTGESSNQPPRVTSPPTGDIKPRPKFKKYIECYSGDQSQLETCEARCQCTPFGAITCDRYNEAAIEKAIGSVIREGKKTREWALLKVTEHSLKQLIECEPICACYEKAGVGNYRVATKTVKQSTKMFKATRDLSLPATGLLQPRSDTEISISEQSVPSKTPASSPTSSVTCAGLDREHGWNARHCQERCHCTSTEEVVCDGDATAEVAALKFSMGADNAEKFVGWNRATIASECTRLCQCALQVRPGKAHLYSPIRSSRDPGTASQSSLNPRSGLGSPYPAPVNVSPNPSALLFSNLVSRGNEVIFEPEREAQADITGLAQSRIQERKALTLLEKFRSINIQRRSGAGPSNRESLSSSSSSPPRYLSNAEINYRGRFVLECTAGVDGDDCRRRCICHSSGDMNLLHCDLGKEAMIDQVTRPGGPVQPTLKLKLLQSLKSNREKAVQKCKAPCKCIRNWVGKPRDHEVEQLLADLHTGSMAVRNEGGLNRRQTPPDQLLSLSIHRRSNSGTHRPESLPRPQNSTSNTNAKPYRTPRCHTDKQSERGRRCISNSEELFKDMDCDIDAEAKLRRLAGPGGKMPTKILPRLTGQAMQARGETTKDCQGSCTCWTAPGGSIRTNSFNLQDPQFRAMVPPYRRIQSRSDVAPSNLDELAQGPASPPMSPSKKAANRIKRLECNNHPKTSECQRHCNCTSDGIITCNKSGLSEQSKSNKALSSIEEDTFSTTMETINARITRECEAACECKNKRRSLADSLSSMSLNAKSVAISKSKGKSKAGGRADKMKWRAEESPGPSARRVLFPRSPPNGVSSSLHPRPSLVCAQRPPLTPKCFAQCRCSMDAKMICDLNLPHAIQGFRLRLSRQLADENIQIYTNFMTSICSDHCGCQAHAAPRIAADTTDVKVAHLEPKPSLNPIKPRGVINLPGKVELVCSGSEGRYCLQECYCADYGVVKCDRNPPPMIQAFRNSMSEERARREIATYISDLEGRCGHSCRCVANDTKRKAESVLEHSHSIRPRSSAEVSRNDLEFPAAEASQLGINPDDTAGLPLQPRSPAGPSTASVRPPLSPNPSPKKAIKVTKATLRCEDREVRKSIWCDDRCDCTPEGRLRCEKKSAGAIKAFTGTRSSEGVIITEEMAVELVMHVSANIVGLCSEICDCGKGPRGDTRERWRKQHRGGRSEEEFDRHLVAPFNWGQHAAKDTAWNWKTGVQRNLPPSITLGPSFQTGTPVDPSTASSSSQPPSARTSSLQRRSAGRPSVYLDQKHMHIECFDPKSHTCERSCYCNPQGTISCDRNAAATVEAVSGTRIGDIVVTATMAKEKVKAREVEMVKKCSELCYCADGPWKTQGNGYEMWKSLQRGKRPKATLEKAENQASVRERGLDDLLTFTPSARHGSPSRPEVGLKHVKRLECVDTRAQTCRTSCHCDAVTSLVICDTLSEDASGAFAGSEGSPARKKLGERIREETLAQVQDLCGQLCQCVDRSGKGNQSHKVSGTRAQRAKLYASMVVAKVPRLGLRGLDDPSVSESGSRTDSSVPSPSKSQSSRPNSSSASIPLPTPVTPAVAAIPSLGRSPATESPRRPWRS